MVDIGDSGILLALLVEKSGVRAVGAEVPAGEFEYKYK